MLITTQGGQLRVATAAGALLPTAAVTVPQACTNSERGLLGVAVDPQFATNHFIYLYYTTSATGACRNRVSRWVLSDRTRQPARRSSSTGSTRRPATTTPAT